MDRVVLQQGRPDLVNGIVRLAGLDAVGRVVLQQVRQDAL